MLKKKIVELCMKVALKEGVKCDAYFPSDRKSKNKVVIKYGHDLYSFKTYREAIKFLSN